MLLKFLVNIHQIKSKYDVVISTSENIESYYLRGLEIDKMIERSGEIIRFDTLDKLRTEELTSTEKLKYLQLSINYIFPKALDKKIDGQQSIQSIMWLPASEKD